MGRINEDDKTISIVWSLEDVQEVRHDLTDEQAWEVLKTADHYHDANYGICWDTLRCHADDMYPNPDYDSDDYEDGY